MVGSPQNPLIKGRRHGPSRMVSSGKIMEIQRSAPAPVEEAIDIMSSLSRAAEFFLEQPGAEQRRLLQVIMEKAAWKDRMLETTLFEPFEIRAIPTAKVSEKKAR